MQKAVSVECGSYLKHPEYMLSFFTSKFYGSKVQIKVFKMTHENIPWPEAIKYVALCCCLTLIFLQLEKNSTFLIQVRQIDI